MLTREAVAGEAVDGGFSAVYPVLRALEEAGRIRRGYFVDGLGAAQFALPGAVDRLRAMRDQPGELAGEHGRVVHLLAAADPANPYGVRARRGRAGPRPTAGRSSARPGAYVVLVDGAAVALPRPRRLLDPGAARRPTTRRRWPPRSARSHDLVADGRVRELVIGKVDGEPVATSPLPGRAPRRRGSSRAIAGTRCAPAPAPERAYPRPAPTRRLG